MKTLILLLALALAPLAFVPGCANTPPSAVAYHTLRDTQIAVDRAMQTYGTLCAKGKVNPARQLVIDNAHAKYRAAFRLAVATARMDYSKITPNDAQTLANELLTLIAAL